MLLKDLPVKQEAFVNAAFIQAPMVAKLNLEVSLKQGARACYRIVKLTERFLTVYMKETPEMTIGSLIPIPVAEPITGAVPNVQIKRKSN